MARPYRQSEETFRQRRNRRLAKWDKCQMMELLLSEYERQSEPDHEYILDLKRRLDETRQQLKVMSS